MDILAPVACNLRSARGENSQRVDSPNRKLAAGSQPRVSDLSSARGSEGSSGSKSLDDRIAAALAQGNTKPLFSFVAGKSGSSNVIKTIDGCPAGDDQAKADGIAEAFASIFTHDDGKLPEINRHGTRVVGAMEHVEVHDKGVEAMLCRLDRRKAGGPDGLTPSLLRFVATNISCAVSAIFRHSLNTGVVPREWKTALVVPIHKKGDRANPLNYRPISLTSILSKTMEHILTRYIKAHLEDNSLLCSSQHGFRRNHSCESQLLSTMEDLLTSYDEGTQSDIIALDMAKAFDTVSHNKLLHKLKHLGMHPTVTTWIQKWLDGRTFRVVANGVHSKEMMAVSGVPQGSVLGPTLFLIYINDLPDCIRHSKVRLYADDALLYTSIKDASDAEALQEDLSSVCSWAEQWQLTFNISKCEQITTTRRRSSRDIKYYMDGVQLPVVSDFKYLGVVKSNDLTFETHISNTAKKANSRLGMLRRCLRGANANTKTLAYTAMVRPILEYASVIWSPYKKREEKVVESVQRRAFRWAYRIRRRDPISGRMTQEGWDTLCSRRKNKDRAAMQSILLGNLAVDSCFKLTNSHSHNTRYGNVRRRHYTRQRKHSFLLRCTDYAIIDCT